MDATPVGLIRCVAWEMWKKKRMWKFMHCYGINHPPPCTTGPMHGHKVTGIPVARPDTVRGQYTTVVKLMISAKDRSPFHQSSPPP